MIQWHLKGHKKAEVVGSHVPYKIKMNKIKIGSIKINRLWWKVDSIREGELKTIYLATADTWSFLLSFMVHQIPHNRQPSIHKLNGHKFCSLIMSCSCTSSCFLIMNFVVKVSMEWVLKWVWCEGSFFSWDVNRSLLYF